MADETTLRTGAARLATHARNAGWSTVEYLFYPLLMLAATPAYVDRLGAPDYGLWMLVAAITGFGSAANFGMGTATVRFVAACRGRDDPGGVAATVRQTLSIAVGGGLFFAIALLAAAPWLARHVFENMGSTDKVGQTLVIAAFLLFVQQFDAVYASAIKGLERFDVASRTEMAIKLTLVGTCLATAWLTRDLIYVLGILCAVTCAGVLARGVIAGRLIGAGVLLPGWSREGAREVFSFGVWNCLQGMAAALFQNADRLLIGAYLGAGAVAYFSVCTQLAQQIHTLPAAAMAVLLPLAARRSVTGSAGLARIRKLSVGVNLLVASLLALGLFLIGPRFLNWWMGAEFAGHAQGVLPWLTLGYFLLALGVAPHFLLLGQGQARFVSLSNIAGGAATLLCAALLIPAAGVLGAAWSRIAYGPLLVVNYVRLFRKAPT
jgi:O-antigen/teichoic acid export membrane protein